MPGGAGYRPGSTSGWLAWAQWGVALDDFGAACLDVVDDAGHGQLAWQLRIGGEEGHVAADRFARVGDGRGYADVGVGEISGHAGATSGAVYHHFGSKAGLFRAVYDELVAGTSERIAAARRSSPSPSLMADCELYLDACANPAFFRITADAPAVIGWDAILDDTQELIAVSLAAAQADGEISPALPVATLARMLAAALKEAGVMIATASDPARARADASASARYLIAGLQRTRP